MSVRNLDAIFAAKSAALIGASTRQGSVGGLALRNLRRCGFHGDLMLVNPKYAEIDGQRVYPSVASLPSTPDLAVITTPPASVPGLIAELGGRGTRGAIVVTAGFGEGGEQGKALQREILDAAKPHLLRIVGPNCLGAMVPGIGLDASFSHLAPKPGQIAFVSQSGAMVTAMLDWAAPRELGFSHVVSLGDMADVDFGDMLDYLAADSRTRAILLYVEAVTHGRKFMSAARAAARTKPVLVLKAGRSQAGARAAASHTGALAGADAVYDAAFRRAGMLRVDTMAQLFEAAETLALTGEQIGNHLAIVTNGGGAGVLAADALAAAGGELAALAPETTVRLDRMLPATWSRGNPVDIIGDASGARYAGAISAVLADPGVDALLVLNCPTALASSDDAARAVIDSVDAARSRRHGVNVFTAWLGDHTARAARHLFAEAGIAAFDTPDGAVTAFAHCIRHRHNRMLLMETPPARPAGVPMDAAKVATIVADAVAAGVSWLSPEAAGAVLEAYGIPMAASRICADVDQVAEAAAAVGFPCVLKIRSPDITHKRDIGGVTLRLADGEAARKAAIAMLEQVKRAQPRARIDGFLLQPMVERQGAAELLVGLSSDAVFGPVIAFGQGGTAVEIVNDTALEFPPLNPLLARAQMARTRIWKLLQGYRGKPPADIDAIADTLIRIGQLAIDHLQIGELDINPLLADESGIIALDARIRIVSVVGPRRLAIAPYPHELDTVEYARDGTPVHVRPLRPEDEPLLHDLAAHMNGDDLRLRFFTPVRGLTHAVAARLSQLDYDREIGLLAEQAGVALGVAHFFADPDNRRAEYAIAIRSDWKGRGVGYLLMSRLIAIAAQRGVGELVGEVLRENRPMLEMCRELGFSIAPDPTDPAVVSVRKPLNPAGA
jgi:acetyltransferase